MTITPSVLHDLLKLTFMSDEKSNCNPLYPQTKKKQLDASDTSTKDKSGNKLSTKEQEEKDRQDLERSLDADIDRVLSADVNVQGGEETSNSTTDVAPIDHNADKRGGAGQTSTSRDDQTDVSGRRQDTGRRQDGSDDEDDVDDVTSLHDQIRAQLNKQQGGGKLKKSEEREGKSVDVKPKRPTSNTKTKEEQYKEACKLTRFNFKGKRFFFVQCRSTLY